jgi:hypothetical protein
VTSPAAAGYAAGDVCPLPALTDDDALLAWGTRYDCGHYIWAVQWHQPWQGHTEARWVVSQLSATPVPVPVVPGGTPPNVVDVRPPRVNYGDDNPSADAAVTA